MTINLELSNASDNSYWATSRHR